MPEPLPRRSFLGATGAALLTTLLPWRPREHDIVIASEVPTLQPVQPRRIGEVVNLEGTEWLLVNYSLNIRRDTDEFINNGYREQVARTARAELDMRLVSINNFDRHVYGNLHDAVGKIIRL